MGRAGATRRPASSPPALILASKTESSVVLPIFHRLVSSVIFPAARKPCHSQFAVGAAIDITSESRTTDGTVAANGGGTGSARMGCAFRWEKVSPKRKLLAD